MRTLTLGDSDPAPPPLTVAQARAVTAGLREAMDDVRRSVAVLAARVRDAHAVRVRVPLGLPSWETYCDAEFGLSRAHAYQLLDIARALAAIHDAVDAGPDRLACETPTPSRSTTVCPSAP
ncbi:hypothetical protein ACFWUZ_30195 [Streptomyces sp. NPDC058646]|uniref:hypothetical protein n=1 Tax=Streptomyces sp. NPDC058646 TaxID=3346574 RepID=UPI00364B482A